MSPNRKFHFTMPGVDELMNSLLAIFIIAAPFAVSRHALPVGWEIPKVFVAQVFGAVLLIAAGVAFFRSDAIRKRLASAPKSVYISLASLIIISIISTVLSSYTRDPGALPYENPLYRLFETAGMEISKVSVFGDIFRDFGLITFFAVLIIGVGALVFQKEGSWRVLFYAFILSAVVQSLIGIYQFIDLLMVETLSPTAGTWITGTFGQANFFAGHLLTGLIFSLYFLKNGNRWDFLFLIPTILIMGGLVASFSTWAIILMLLAVCLILVYEITPTRLKTPLFAMLLTVFTSTGILVLAFSYSSPQPNRFRTYIWKNTIDVYLVEPGKDLSEENTTLILFGSGFDTLGKKLDETNRLTGNYVDRGHNIFLDALATMGITGLVATIALLGLLFYQWLRNLHSPINFYIGLAAIIWTGRAFIHTSSILNITDFAIILGLLAGSLYFAKFPTTSIPRK